MVASWWRTHDVLGTLGFLVKDGGEHVTQVDEVRILITIIKFHTGKKSQ